MMMTDVKADAQMAESDESTDRPGGVEPELVGWLVAQAREQEMEPSRTRWLLMSSPKRPCRFRWHQNSAAKPCWSAGVTEL